MNDKAIPPPETFGRRIMVCGPSNAGKSTLAAAIGAKLGIEPVHLDRLYHEPNTNWVPRPLASFDRLHDATIAGDAWIMDGNYSRLFPPRLARATGIILLLDNRWAGLFRYVRRTFRGGHVGALEGARDSIRWKMIHWILIASPTKIPRYRRELIASGLPYLELRSMHELKALYLAWGLSR